MDIGRSAVFEKLGPVLNDWGNNRLNRYIGIGIGQADYSSSVMLFNSKFYQIYNQTHYMWLSLAFLFVETGYIGIIMYISFFIVLFIDAVYKYRVKNKEIFLMNILMSLFCLIILLYNASMRSNCAYIVFFMLAVPYVNDGPVLPVQKYKFKLRMHRR